MFHPLKSQLIWLNISTFFEKDDEDVVVCSYLLKYLSTNNNQKTMTKKMRERLFIIHIIEPRKCSFSVDFILYFVYPQEEHQKAYKLPLSTQQVNGRIRENSLEACCCVLLTRRLNFEGSTRMMRENTRETKRKKKIWWIFHVLIYLSKVNFLHCCFFFFFFFVSTWEIITTTIIEWEEVPSLFSLMIFTFSSSFHIVVVSSPQQHRKVENSKLFMNINFWEFLKILRWIFPPILSHPMILKPKLKYKMKIVTIFWAIFHFIRSWIFNNFHRHNISTMRKRDWNNNNFSLFFKLQKIFCLCFFRLHNDNEGKLKEHKSTLQKSLIKKVSQKAGIMR